MPPPPVQPEGMLMSPGAAIVSACRRHSSDGRPSVQVSPAGQSGCSAVAFVDDVG